LRGLNRKFTALSDAAVASCDLSAERRDARGAAGERKRRERSTRGIVEDGKYTANLAEHPQPAMFFPILQSPSGEAWLVVRSNRDPQLLGAAIKNKLRDLDAGLPVFIQTWNQEMSGALFAPRMATLSLGVLGVMGAMLSITGIFGMAAYSVSKRLKELGIRMACLQLVFIGAITR
jgi:hypothetical protein